MGLLDSVERLHTGLDYHLARQNLLTANLAHIDTPGFRPLDLERRAGFDAELHAALATTDARHISHTAGSSTGDERWRLMQDPRATASSDGNAVSIDREAVKIATNQLRYDTLAQLATSELSGLAWAANDGRAA